MINKVVNLGAGIICRTVQLRLIRVSVIIDSLSYVLYNKFTN